ACKPTWPLQFFYPGHRAGELCAPTKPPPQTRPDMTPPPPTTALPRPSLLLAVSSAALKISSAAASPARGVRWQGVGVGRGRSRAVGRCWAAAVEEAGAQEQDGVLLPQEGEGSEAAGRYDWREEWYPLYLSKEVPDDAALPLTVFDRQLVLYRDAAGVLRCHEDRCPHRLAKLSEGQLVDGKLECLYHGWQFDGEGKCVKIPQVLSRPALLSNQVHSWISTTNA
uniref:Rieske domain-containing protein n=1 Tax=Aegilops tauschii subsp. strangulata TaxID=200361 RepID=A0A453PVA9_AEGTS